MQKIELDDSRLGLRTLLALLCLVIGAVGIGTALFRALPSAQDKEESTIDWPNAQSFGFLLLSGNEDEQRQARLLCLREGRELDMLFDGCESREDVRNLRYLSDHPNEVVEVDSRLYDALSLLEAAGCSAVTGPLFELYEGLFGCEWDWESALFDPALGEDAAAYVEELLPYLRSEVSLELLGDNRVRLAASEAYLRFAGENEIQRLLDFGWLKNALILDALAGELAESGVHDAILSSREGYVRTLGTACGSIQLWDWQEGRTVTMGVLPLPPGSSAVTLRAFPLRAGEAYYVREDGVCRSAHISAEDGLCHDAYSFLLGCGELSCTELALLLRPIQIAERADDEALGALWEAGVSAVFCREGAVWYDDPTLLPQGAGEETLQLRTFGRAAD